MRTLLAFCAASALVLSPQALAQAPAPHTDSAAATADASHTDRSSSDHQNSNPPTAAPEADDNADHHSETPPAAHGAGDLSQDAFVIAGQCAWAPNPEDLQGGTGALDLANIGTRIVEELANSFTSVIAQAAAGQTQETVAQFVFDPEHDQCIQLVRGHIDPSVSPDIYNRLARAAFPAAPQPAPSDPHPGATQDPGAVLWANGLRLSTPPDLIVEVRIHSIRRAPANAQPGNQRQSRRHKAADDSDLRFVVLEPTFIGYRNPSFRQLLRSSERSFALQLQLAETPNVPGDTSVGGQVMLGRRKPSHQHFFVSRDVIGKGVIQTPLPADLASHSFQIDRNKLYNARISVSESSSPSAFYQFWSNVLAAQSENSDGNGAQHGSAAENGGSPSGAANHH